MAKLKLRILLIFKYAGVNHLPSQPDPGEQNVNLALSCITNGQANTINSLHVAQTLIRLLRSIVIVNMNTVSSFVLNTINH